MSFSCSAFSWASGIALAFDGLLQRLGVFDLLLLGNSLFDHHAFLDDVRIFRFSISTALSSRYRQVLLPYHVRRLPIGDHAQHAQFQLLQSLLVLFRDDLTLHILSCDLKLFLRVDMSLLGS